MNSEIKAQWIAALESGEYKQCRNSLTKVSEDGTTQGHCCLGVLTELAVAAGITTRVGVSESHSVQYSDDNEYDGHTTALPPLSVQRWAELSDNNPIVKLNAVPHALAELNDEIGLSFPEIADLIREQL